MDKEQYMKNLWIKYNKSKNIKILDLRQEKQVIINGK